MYQSSSVVSRAKGGRVLLASSPLQSGLHAVEEEEGLEEVSPFAIYASRRPPAGAEAKWYDEEEEEMEEDVEEEEEEEEELIIEESEFLNDAAATPPTPSTPSFVATPRPGSAGSRKTEDGDADQIAGTVTSVTLGGDSVDLEDIGSTIGLTSHQIAARRVLKTRNLWRTSRGEGRGPIHFDHMGMLLRSFDALVLEYGDKAPLELKGPEFWERFEEIEESAARGELLDETEKQFKNRINEVESTLQQRLEVLEKQQEEENAAQDALANGQEVSEDELYAQFPGFKAHKLDRVYARYKLPFAIPETHKGTDLEAESRQIATFSPSSTKRLMSQEEIRRQREAERNGAPLPMDKRHSDRLLPSSIIHFDGPVFKSSGAHLAEEAADDGAPKQPTVRWSALGDPIVPVGARLRRTDKDPNHKREVAPEPPPMPTRESWARACKAAGQHRTWKGKSKSLRAAFLTKYTPQPLVGVPLPPAPPGSFPALPLPGEPLPACQLRVRGLPMKCSEEQIKEFFMPDSELIQDKNKDGFKDGIKIFRAEKDGWLTGEAIVKFQTKRAAMNALLKFDRRLMGDRVIHLAYYMEKIPEPRGRLMVSGVHRKTSEKDLREFFSGWHLAPSEDGHDPEVLNDEEGWPNGDAVITFMDVAAADNALVSFDFEKKLHGMTLKVQAVEPLEYDEISESWLPALQLAESTELILEELAEEESYREEV